MDLLTSYDWPGNVRELQNVIQRAVILCEGTRPVDETTTTAVEFDRAVKSPLDVTASDASGGPALIAVPLELRVPREMDLVHRSRAERTR
jgi:DNA-binding NtrC family response regulator